MDKIDKSVVLDLIQELSILHGRASQTQLLLPMHNVSGKGDVQTHVVCSDAFPGLKDNWKSSRNAFTNSLSIVQHKFVHIYKFHIETDCAKLEVIPNHPLYENIEWKQTNGKSIYPGMDRKGSERVG